MKVCWVAIVGRPNVGKSTLINNLIEYELSIVTPVAQTTRDKILGIYTNEEYQFIFFDTPGIHKPQSKLGESLNEKAFESIKEANLVLFLQPIDEAISDGDKFILDKIKNIKQKICIITKLDKSKDPILLQQKIEQFKKYEFNNILSSSYKYPNSIIALIDEIKKYAIEDNPYYDEDYITDKSELFLTKEIIRKNAINNLKQEIPHSIAIEITEYNYDEKNNKKIINATIFCSKESQKSIIIGKQGSMIKKIGSASREEIINKFGVPTQLNLIVKVNKNWVNNENNIKRLGY